MQWFVRERMRRAIDVIDLIPNVHRTAALATLRRAALAGHSHKLRLTPAEKELAFYDAHFPLLSPIGARLLLALYREGQIKLKKPMQASLPKLEAYAATEAAFLAEVEEQVAVENAKRSRLIEICENPDQALPEEITIDLINRVITAKLGHGVSGKVRIAGLDCFRGVTIDEIDPESPMRPEPRFFCYWIDADGNRQGEKG